ncbi:hypothetical protein Taro_016367 [Colocasia esculenta]|uniref:RING-type domain-containing protein n=1 Tax=Colocasia esculenta TaxID=4460 RepID=A0A843UPY3_COLES|nr:hypothetical protein [Colocasia esculenta]
MAPAQQQPWRLRSAYDRPVRPPTPILVHTHQSSPTLFSSQSSVPPDMAAAPHRPAAPHLLLRPLHPTAVLFLFLFLFLLVSSPPAVWRREPTAAVPKLLPLPLSLLYLAAAAARDTVRSWRRHPLLLLLPRRETSCTTRILSTASIAAATTATGVGCGKPLLIMLLYRPRRRCRPKSPTHLGSPGYRGTTLCPASSFSSPFVSMTLILGFYGSVNIVLGPNSSRLLNANSYFVQDIKLQLETDRPGSLLYGFSNRPPLDIRSMWSESHNASIPANFHKAWVYYLNEGSQVEVAYHVKSPGSSSLVLAIAQGSGYSECEISVITCEENFDRWMEDPLFFTTTLSWNLINGTGFVQQKIFKSSDYYVAVGNLKSLPAEVSNSSLLTPAITDALKQVELKIAINASLYNTTRAYYNCSLHQDSCVMKISFLGENAAILATSGPQQDEGSNVWYVKMSYGPRWIMYFVGSGLMSIIILLAVKIFSYFYASSEDTTNSQAADEAHERTPLLSNKDDDDSSLGSSYDSVSNEEGDIEEHLEVAMKEPKPVRGSEVCESQHLCAICCNAPRDCFFLPCGHCATCFTCGTRVTEDAGTCPICRRRMKKVKKIFSV